MFDQEVKIEKNEPEIDFTDFRHQDISINNILSQMKDIDSMMSA